MLAIPRNIRSVVDHDGAVILDIPRNTMTALDAVGAYVWRKLQCGLQVDAIVAELATDTGADKDMIAKDVDDFMEQLKSRHLVVAIRDPNLALEP
jgi:hypothetical protein